MRGYIAFIKKEMLEMVRSYKLLIMGIIYFILGMMNPITAKFTPDLLKNVMPEGISITIAEPVAMDSWLQFFKNLPQMGLIVLVIVYSGCMANEISKGTLINVLTKGLSRKSVILAKFTSIGLIWTLSFYLSFVISLLYTKFFWEESVPNLLFAVFCLWVFGLLLIAIIILGGVINKNNYGALLFTALFVAILFLLNIIPQMQDYNPIMLASSNTSLLNLQKDVSDFIAPLIESIVLCILALVGAIAIFNKKKL